MFTKFQFFSSHGRFTIKYFNLDLEYPHTHNASKKETQTRHFRSQGLAKVEDRFFSHKWANVMWFRHCCTPVSPAPRINNDADDEWTRWMSAYRSMGLTGGAAQWAVRKPKGHRSVSRTAMLHFRRFRNRKLTFGTHICAFRAQKFGTF